MKIHAGTDYLCPIVHAATKTAIDLGLIQAFNDTPLRFPSYGQGEQLRRCQIRLAILFGHPTMMQENSTMLGLIRILEKISTKLALIAYTNLMMITRSW